MTPEAAPTWFGSVDPISLKLTRAGSAEEMAERLLAPAAGVPASRGADR